MPKNLEIKAKIPNVQHAISIAYDLYASYKGELHQIDTYFNVHHGRLKLREILNDHFELIYYERNEESQQRLSTFELYPVVDVNHMKKMLTQANGVIGIVEKRRTLFIYKNTRIHVDEVQRLGTFLEFETAVTETEEDAKKFFFPNGGVIPSVPFPAKKEVYDADLIILIQRRSLGLCQPTSKTTH